MNSGFTVISDGTAPDVTTDTDTYSIDGDYIGGGFGRAYGGTIYNVHLLNLQKAESANNYAAGFIAAAGPGDIVSSGSLTINLLGLNNLINVSNLLSIGQHIHVTVIDSDVTGIEEGAIVISKGSGASNEAYRYIAAGFIAQSNSTEIQNCHVYNLYFVKAHRSAKKVDL